MRILLLAASLLVSAPAFAQTATPAADPGLLAWKLMYDQATLREQNATSVALDMQRKVEMLTKQVADLTAQTKDAAPKADPAATK